MFYRLRQFATVRGYRRRYRGAQISGQARLSGVTLGDAQVRILGDAYLDETTVGSNVTVHPHCWIRRARLGESIHLGPETGMVDVAVGSFGYFAGHSTIHNTTFGRFCSVGRELLCGLGEHPTGFVSSSPVFYSTRGQCNTTFAERDAFDENAPVEIGSDVWIGARAFVRNGVRVGHGAIIAAGAVVVADVPDYAIVAGTPARVIRLRFSDSQIERMMKVRWWDWDESRLRAGAAMCASDDIDAFLAWAESVAEVG